MPRLTLAIDQKGALVALGGIELVFKRGTDQQAQRYSGERGEVVWIADRRVLFVFDGTGPGRGIEVAVPEWLPRINRQTGG